MCVCERESEIENVYVYDCVCARVSVCVFACMFAYLSIPYESVHFLLYILFNPIGMCISLGSGSFVINECCNVVFRCHL